MHIPKRFWVLVSLFAAAVALVLWFVGIIPLWAVIPVTIVAPFAVAAILIVVFYALWMASGAH